MTTANPPSPQVRESTGMPPYVSIVTIDVEGYSRHSSRHQKILNLAVRDVLAEAFDRASLGALWADASFPQHTGDGYVVGVAPQYLPFLVHPLLGVLQDVLAEAQPDLARQDRRLRLRVRVSIGLGPLPDSGGSEYGDGVGTAMNETHRLLDAPALREALAASDPDVTLLVAGLTLRAYEDAVLGGYTALAPAHFREVEVDLPNKGYRARGYLHVPVPSIAAEAGGRNGSADSRDVEPREQREQGGRRGMAVFEPNPNRV